jgi:hypothetical protein
MKICNDSKDASVPDIHDPLNHLGISLWSRMWLIVNLVPFTRGPRSGGVSILTDMATPNCKKLIKQKFSQLFLSEQNVFTRTIVNWIQINKHFKKNKFIYKNKNNIPQYQVIDTTVNSFDRTFTTTSRITPRILS